MSKTTDGRHPPKTSLEIAVPLRASPFDEKATGRFDDNELRFDPTALIEEFPTPFKLDFTSGDLSLWVSDFSDLQAESGPLKSASCRFSLEQSNLARGLVFVRPCVGRGKPYSWARLTLLPLTALRTKPALRIETFDGFSSASIDVPVTEPGFSPTVEAEGRTSFLVDYAALSGLAAISPQSLAFELRGARRQLVVTVLGRARPLPIDPSPPRWGLASAEGLHELSAVDHGSFSGAIEYLAIAAETDNISPHLSVTSLADGRGRAGTIATIFTLNANVLNGVRLNLPNFSLRTVMQMLKLCSASGFRQLEAKGFHAFRDDSVLYGVPKLEYEYENVDRMLVSIAPHRFMVPRIELLQKLTSLAFAGSPMVSVHIGADTGRGVARLTTWHGDDAWEDEIAGRLDAYADEAFPGWKGELPLKQVLGLLQVSQSANAALHLGNDVLWIEDDDGNGLTTRSLFGTGTARKMRTDNPPAQDSLPTTAEPSDRP